MNVGPRALREAFEEVLHELRLEIADALHLQPQVDDGVRAAAEIDRGDRQRFVHRHDEVAGAIDPRRVPSAAETASPRAIPRSSTV